MNVTAKAITERVNSIDCELSAYRKGILSVSLNLQLGTIIWRESQQWCNNFIRSLTSEQVGRLRKLVAELINGVDPLETAGENPVDGRRLPDAQSLKLTVFFPDCQLTLADEAIDQTRWSALCREIEKLSRVPFRF